MLQSVLRLKLSRSLGLHLLRFLGLSLERIREVLQALMQVARVLEEELPVVVVLAAAEVVLPLRLSQVVDDLLLRHAEPAEPDEVLLEEKGVLLHPPEALGLLVLLLYLDRRARAEALEHFRRGPSPRLGGLEDPLPILQVPLKLAGVLGALLHVEVELGQGRLVLPYRELALARGQLGLADQRLQVVHASRCID